ncbi:MAG: TolB-like protein [Sulfurimonas sp.]|jgi:TolB-like protein
MKKLFSSALIVSSILVSSICAGDFQYRNNVQNYNDRSGNVNVAGYMNRLSSSIAEQLSQNKDFQDVKNTPIAIMSIVDMNNFKKTCPVSKRISENLIHEMHVRGYKVVDYKAMSQIEIDSNGDYVFSRAIKDLKNQRNIVYALSGTYTKYRDGMAINCRIIDIKTSIVLSTAQVFVPKKVLRSIDKLSNNSSWFADKKAPMKNHNVQIKER